MRDARHVVRPGPIAWSLAAVLAMLGAATGGAVLEGGLSPAYAALSFGLALCVIVRTAIGGVWLDRDQEFVVRDWMRTRRYPAGASVSVTCVPYNGFATTYQDSRFWANVAFVSDDARSRPCRLTIASFAATKRNVALLRSSRGTR